MGGRSPGGGGSPGALAAAAALFVIAYEEPHLRQTFGAPYEDYLTHVPRWIPRLRAYRA